MLTAKRACSAPLTARNAACLPLDVVVACLYPSRKYDRDLSPSCCFAVCVHELMKRSTLLLIKVLPALMDAREIVEYDVAKNIAPVSDVSTLSRLHPVRHLY
jgi:hypothetical protein